MSVGVTMTLYPMLWECWWACILRIYAREMLRLLPPQDPTELPRLGYLLGEVRIYPFAFALQANVTGTQDPTVADALVAYDFFAFKAIGPASRRRRHE